MNEHEMRIRELEIALEANQLLLVMETGKARQAHAQIVSIGHELGGEAFDESLDGRKAEDLHPEELAGRIIAIIKVSLALRGPDSGELVALRREVAEKGRQLDTQTRRASKAEETIRQLRLQVHILDENRDKLRREVEKLKATVRSLEETAPSADLEQWFEGWRKRANFENLSGVLRFIGETGAAHGPRIEDALAVLRGRVKKTIARDLARLVDEELLGVGKGASDGGAPPNTYWLTEMGRWTYTRLTQQPPVASEIEGLLKAHKSNRQGGLILKAAELFRRFGYIADTKEIRIDLDGGRHFDPDFTVTKDGEVYYIEFETGERVDRASLAHKWENAAAVGGGRICIVGRNKRVMQDIVSNIVGWSMDRGRKVRIYATCLKTLKTRDIAAGPWEVEKER